MDKENAQSISGSGQVPAEVGQKLREHSGILTVAEVEVVQREVVQESALVVKTLETKNAHWTDRVAALERLHKLADRGAAAHPEFLETLVRLKNPLVTQIKDLRSAIVKEACSTIVAVATGFQQEGVRNGTFKWAPGFAGLACVFVDTCMKQTSVSIKVISESADSCISSVVRSAAPLGVGKMLARFCDGISDKASHIRLVCVQYIELALKCWKSLNKSANNRRLGEVHESIKSALHDADSLVREAARRCYWALEARSPETAAALFKQLDSAVGRRLTHAKVAVSLEEIIDVPAEAILPPVSFEREPRFTSETASFKSDMMMSFKTDFGEGMLAEMRDDDVVEGSGNGESDSQQVVITSRKPVMQEEPIQNQHAPVTSRRIAGPQRIVTRNHHLSPATQAESEPVFSKHHLGGAIRIEHSSNSIQDAAPPPLVSHVSSRMSDAGASSESPTHSVNLDRLVRELESSDHWKTRIDSMLDIMTAFEEGRLRTSSITPPINRLVAAMCERAADSHHKVTLEVLRGVNRLLGFFRKAFQENLKVLVPNLLAGVADSKYAIRQEAEKALKLCTEIFSADTMASVLSSTLRAKAEKTRQGCLEYLIQVAPNAKAFFGNETHVLQALKRVDPCLQSKTGRSLRTLAVEFCKCLFTLDAEIVQRIILHEELPDAVSSTLDKVSRKAATAPSRKIIEQQQDIEEEQIHPVPEKEIGPKNSPPSVQLLQQEQEPVEEEDGNEEGDADELGEVLSASLRENEDKEVNQLIAITIGSASSAEQRFQALETLKGKLDSADATGAPILRAALDRFTDDEMLIRENAISIVTILSSRYPQIVENSLEECVEAMLKLHGRKHFEMTNSVVSLFLHLSKTIGPRKCYNVILRILNSDDADFLRGSLVVLHSIFERLSTEDLERAVKELMPRLAELFDHQEPNIRRQVMYCYVRLHKLIGRSFSPYIEMLATSKRKLIAIYVEREAGSGVK